jgi:hypothetical protein
VIRPGEDAFICSFIGEERERGEPTMKVIERVQPRYEVQEVEFGKVYKWRPERIVLECECGKSLSLTASTTSCLECGRDHMLAVKGASMDRPQSDHILHPWRYSEDREDAGLPF